MLDEDPDAVLAGGHRASRIDTRKDVDGWTVRTVSGAVSCHLEQTIAVTRFGSDVLTNGNQTPMVARKFGKE
jgi:methionine aminopeptidase